MPYYIHPKDSPPPVAGGNRYTPDETPGTYATRADAFAACEVGSTVSFVLSANEDRRWRERERARFHDGEYCPVPWSNRTRTLDGDDPRALHFPHLSIDHPGLIAYTIDAEHGVLDRQTRIKPGRYLAKFYAELFTADEIAAYCHECGAEGQALTVTQDEGEIRRIYDSRTVGVSTCMQSKDEAEYDWQRAYDDGNQDHPAIVYAGPDLGIAYRGPIDCVTQRAVVWPAKKRYVRIYGDGPLRALLTRDGYTVANDLCGARLRRLPIDGQDDTVFLMPYIDGGTNATDRGGYLVLDPDGALTTQELSGHTENGEAEHYECANCGGERDEDEMYCNSCRDNVWSCGYCSADSFDHDSIGVDGDPWCGRCVRRHATQCERCEDYYSDNNHDHCPRCGSEEH